MDDLLLDDPIRFIHPGGTDIEWAPVEEWDDRLWAHWLAQHNKYPFLRQWSDPAIAQYLDVDRWKYGLHLQRSAKEERWWLYRPTPIAVPFHAAKERNILFGGAAGGSKSHSARFDAYMHCFGIPGFRAIIMRRTFEELQRNHLDKAKTESQMVNNYFGARVMDFVEGRHELTFRNHPEGKESKIIFGHCQNLGDEDKYLGDEYHAFYPDEMATFLRKQIIGVQGRLRSSIRWADGTKTYRVRPRSGGTSNPGGAQTLWLKDEYIDRNVNKVREINPRYKPEQHVFIQAMLYDNPYYMDPDGTYTDYEDRLFAYDPERRRQLLLGDWSALAGQFFPEFSVHRHVASLPIPSGSRIERWVDWGYAPHYGMCLWVAIFPNGRLYVFAEFKFNGEHARTKLVAAQVAQRIKELTNTEIAAILLGQPRISKSVGDPSMWSADGHSGEDYAETFRRNGVSMIKADNDRVMGWGRLRHWFNNAPDSQPWLMIHPSCTTTIRTVPGLVRDKNDPDDIDTTGEDHPADCLRYGVMARPTPRREMTKPKIIIPDTPSAVLASVLSVPNRSFGQVR